jgi:hypothetical protein
MKKRELERRIADLERQLADANERIKTLEARPVVTYPPAIAPIMPETWPRSNPIPWLPNIIVGDVPPSWGGRSTLTTDGAIGGLGAWVAQ